MYAKSCTFPCTFCTDGNSCTFLRYFKQPQNEEIMTRPDPGLVNLHPLIVITTGGMSAEENVGGILDLGKK